MGVQLVVGAIAKCIELRSSPLPSVSDVAAATTAAAAGAISCVCPNSWSDAPLGAPRPGGRRAALLRCPSVRNAAQPEHVTSGASRAAAARRERTWRAFFALSRTHARPPTVHRPENDADRILSDGGSVALSVYILAHFSVHIHIREISNRLRTHTDHTWCTLSISQSHAQSESSLSRRQGRD